MKIINAYGFSVDYETSRVYLVEGKFAGFTQSIPCRADGITVGTDNGDVVQKLKKVVINSNNNLLYVDLKGATFPDQIHEWEHLPHDKEGRLLMDSVGKVTGHYLGLGFTEVGAVALYADPKPKPEPTDEEAVTGNRFETVGDYRYSSYVTDETSTFTIARTETGKKLDLEVLLVGAGGAGKGQTTTFGLGGDGGGGQLVFGKLPANASGDAITINICKGGERQGDSPTNTTVVEGKTTLTAISGKNAVDKNDAAGYPKQDVPEGWRDLRFFTWLMPGSQQVGGAADSYEQNFPNATFCGEGGSGTKDNKPGSGNAGVVIIRWKK